MIKKFILSFLIFILSVCILGIDLSNAGSIRVPDTDHGNFQLFGFFDLRDRETFIQITNTDSDNQTIHIQIFNVAENCNENNFNDVYTQADTHVYNLRDIQTNDGNPSGVVLTDDSYGIVVATYVGDDPLAMIGNLRILDNSGYEYRTNISGNVASGAGSERDDFTFNFNTESGVILSDIVGMQFDNTADTNPPAEVFAADIVNIWTSWDVDIYDLNEVPFSCRNVIFACTNQNNPLLEALLEESGDANVASFEYGINEIIPSSKNAPLLCPSNTISEGIVRMQRISFGSFTEDINIADDRKFTLYVGLNNGNGRGSMDMLWQDHEEEIFDDE